MSEYLSKYQQSLLDPNVFSVTWELIPGRGAFEKEQLDVLAGAEKAAKGGKVHGITITDNPGGNPAISAEMLGVEINRLGIEPLVHFTCKDKNRNELEAMLYGLERAGVRNILCMSGDYTVGGYKGQARPVFDLDPSQLLGLIGAMNAGQEVPTPTGSARLQPTHFFAGAVTSPFKALEGEQMGQYYKLKKKLEAGAQFIALQLGYDARKLQEALLVRNLLGFSHIPMIASIYILPLGTAKLMNRNGLPGCVVTDELLRQVELESADKTKAKANRLERAAKLYAVLKGLGFAGVHVEGHKVPYEDVEFILARGEELAPNWLDLAREFNYPQPKGWYYFQQDPKTGLNAETPVDRKQQRPPTPFVYRCFRLLHASMFDEKGILFKPMIGLARAMDGSWAEKPFTALEHLGKAFSNECMHCGDCGLPDVAYLCPMSQCPKSQRNGPCGGSYGGWCEVYPNKQQCIYVRAYQRLKHYGKEDNLGSYQVPPVNWDLWMTNSWLNYFCGRDHTAKRIGIKPPEKKEEKK